VPDFWVGTRNPGPKIKIEASNRCKPADTIAHFRCKRSIISPGKRMVRFWAPNVKPSKGVLFSRGKAPIRKELSSSEKSDS